jgi:drug/metabolite transporter (DMT)-like permease
MPDWLPPAALALGVWSLQRVVSKVALRSLGTRKFYLLSAAVSLVVYLPFVAVHPPRLTALPPAIGLACLMALTFGVTTEATRRGPIGVVSPITALGPAITAALAILLLHEAAVPIHLAGIFLAVAGIVLLSFQPASTEVGAGGWLGMALASLALQGVGAFVAKVLVTGNGPSALLISAASVQVLVGLALAPSAGWHRQDLTGRPALYTVLIYAAAAVATIGYLTALSEGPASLVVPLVSTSPALGGLLGIVLLRERFTARQLVGIGASLVGSATLA